MNSVVVQAKRGQTLDDGLGPDDGDDDMFGPAADDDLALDGDDTDVSWRTSGEGEAHVSPIF